MKQHTISLNYIVPYKISDKAKFNQQKEFLIIKQWNVRVNNYICSCALLFDNVHSRYVTKKNVDDAYWSNWGNYRNNRAVNVYVGKDGAF